MSSIYEQIGGRDAVAAAVDIFYERVIADDVLAPYFERTDMRRLKAHMRAFLAAAIGGAELYKGRDMRAAHASLNVTHEAFDHVVAHLVATLAGLGVPAELIEAIGAKIAPLRDVIVTEQALAA